MNIRDDERRTWADSADCWKVKERVIQTSWRKLAWVVGHNYAVREGRVSAAETGEGLEILQPLSVIHASTRANGRVRCKQVGKTKARREVCLFPIQEHSTRIFATQ